MKLDGATAGTPGTEYNYWFNVAATSNTVYVDKSPTTPSGALGSITNPYTTLSAATTAAQNLIRSETSGLTVAAANAEIVANPVVMQVMGNNTGNDFDGRGIQAVAAGAGGITDGQEFTVSDGTTTIEFQFALSTDNVPTGFQRVAFTTSDSAATVAANIVTAVNAAFKTYGLDVTAMQDPVDPTVVILSGPTAIFTAASGCKLASTLEDNVPYLLGKNPNTGAVLADGSGLQVPKGVTAMFNAGAVVKLAAADINVGSPSSAASSDFSLGALQVLGTPQDNVYFTSYNDASLGGSSNSLSSTPKSGDWGGLVFENDYDYLDANSATDPRDVLETQGIFLNYVNHAAITYGGGVTANLSGGASTTYDPIYLIDARPTVTFNTIALSQHAAISADPDSFEQSEFYGDQGTQTDPAIPYTNDYDREGPLVHGNAVSDDVINGLFVRIATSTSGTNAGAPLDTLTVPAVFAATDITYVITENLYIQGQVGGPVNGDLRTAASNGLPIEGRLQIDPGVVLKLLDAHIEVQPDGQLIAEGTDADPVVITSLYDTTYGAGGTFDTDNEPSKAANPGDWGGIEFQPDSSGSIDRARIYYAGGQTPIEGGSASFDPIEIRQAQVRITNTLFDLNSGDLAGVANADRDGRGAINPATIYVLARSRSSSTTPSRTTPGRWSASTSIRSTPRTSPTRAGLRVSIPTAPGIRPPITIPSIWRTSTFSTPGITAPWFG